MNNNFTFHIFSTTILKDMRNMTLISEKTKTRLSTGLLYCLGGKKSGGKLITLVKIRFCFRMIKIH